MLDSIDAIFDYTKDIDFENFKQDRKTYQAVIKEFEIIGEAAKKIPNQITSKYQEIEWRDMSDFRNMLIHEYFGVDLQIVWNTVIDDLPQLKIYIEKIIVDTTGEFDGEAR
jgi:uncharacterized protein with HEPN domain